MKKLAMVLTGLVALVACSDTEGPNISGVDGKEILTLQIQPAADTIFVPDTIRATDRLQLRATAFDPNRRELVITRYVWTSSDSAVAVVDSFGLVRPVGIGSAVISASASRIATAAVVVARITNRVSLTPRNDTILTDDPIGPRDSVRFVAAAADAGGARITGIRLVWSTSIPTVATVDSTGLVRAVSLGSTAITVRSSGSQTVGSITVLPVVKSVVVGDPATTQVLAGDAVTLVARARDYSDAIVTRSFTWTSLAPGVASVDSAGRVVFLDPGSASIIATTAFRSDTVTFTVRSRALQSLDVGNDFACGVGTTGRAWCWGKGTVGQLGTAADSTCFDDNPATPQRMACAIAPKAISGAELVFAQVAAGDSTACGVTVQQQLYCWGDDTFGQIGNGNGGGGATPRLATVGSERFTSVTVGSAHACALNLNGNAYCWGQDSLGQLGNSRLVNSTTPIPVAGPGAVGSAALRFSSISAGGFHTCGITVGGALWCWGDNAVGAVGDSAVTGIADAPVQTLSNERFVQVSAGRRHTCALTEQGAVYCWGSNASRQLANPTVAFLRVPTPVRGGYTGVTVGTDHSCALLASGQLECWGSNSHGQLGRGDPRPSGVSAEPTVVTGARLFRSIAAGRRSTCGIDTTGATFCWGSNNLGTLGNQLQALVQSTPQRLAPLR